MSKKLSITVLMMLLSSIQTAQAGDHGTHVGVSPDKAVMDQGMGGGNHSSQQRAHNQGKRTLYGAEQKGVEYPHVEGMQGLLFQQKKVDGYLLTFHIMKADNHEVIACTYRLMFKAEQNGRPVKNLIVNSRVAHPNSQSESKMMMQMGDWYATAYDLTHPGEHELRVLFKAKDGRMHAASITYFVEKQE